jgi:hypothetical protein
MSTTIPVSAAARALAACAAALLMQPSPAAAQRICGATPVEVSVQVWEKRHAESVARALWSNCARRNYGDAWGRVNLARQPSGVFCYDAGAWRSYYSSDGVVGCSGRDIRYPRWVCFYRATPCRYRPNSNSDDD